MIFCLLAKFVLSFVNGSGVEKICIHDMITCRCIHIPTEMRTRFCTSTLIKIRIRSMIVGSTI